MRSPWERLQRSLSQKIVVTDIKGKPFSFHENVLKCPAPTPHYNANCLQINRHKRINS